MDSLEPQHPSTLRATAIGCLLFLLLVVQFAVLYLFLYLFQLATYRGLDGAVPFVVQGAFTALLVVSAIAMIRREQPAGLLLGAGLLLLAAAPFTVFKGGCEVAATSQLVRPLPHLIWRGIGIGIETANNACSAYLNGILVGIGYVLLAWGLWLGTLPDIALRRLPLGVSTERARNG